MVFTVFTNNFGVGAILVKKTKTKKTPNKFHFHQLSPLGRVGLVVAMCVSLSVCLSVSLFVCPLFM